MRSFVLLIPTVLTSILSQARSPAHAAHVGIERVAGSTTVKELTPAELKAMLGKPNLFLFDRNEVDMFAGAHVPGAVLTVYDAITPDSLPKYKTAKLVFHCCGPECPAGATAARTAAHMGYTDVHSMSAMIMGWQDAGLKTEP